MPKSKVRKKVAVATASSSAQANANSYTTTRVKVAGPSGPLYIGIMLGLMVLGLLWLIVYYLWGGRSYNASGVLISNGLPLMNTLGNWNFAVGFALMIGGLLMTMRWR
ncbi:Uncharacterised protein family (UPF0233) [Nakamurella panacisegetis]|uniref:Cell division protein CrgA n=1 Tax=Nakamurella panacisegetis TaxID=1090615 RepID=A0A1H0KQH9_9ACTN|nr:cell division protein CrgA [Nakamurella panacisegetis]SDO58217.1 Uncharacterised protein family (UPF0233) [Nakamurella panacisegetis]